METEVTVLDTNTHFREKPLNLYYSLCTKNTFINTVLI